MQWLTLLGDVQIQFDARSALQKQLRAPLVSAKVANSPELHDVETLESTYVPTLLQAFKALQLASVAMRDSLEESLPSMQGVLSKIGVVDRASLNMILGSKLQDSQKVAHTTSPEISNPRTDHRFTPELTIPAFLRFLSLPADP